MKLACSLVMSLVVVLFLGLGLANANPINVYSIDDPSQDSILPNGQLHELVDNPFMVPPDEWLYSWGVEEGDFTPCSENYDDPNIPNIYLSVKNASGQDWEYVWYVADTGTTFANYDGYIGNVGLDDAEYAFLVDSVGANIPLIDEDLVTDGVWQNNEVWTFVIQDFVGVDGGSAYNLSSLGIASVSSGGVESTGSIIVSHVPEPSTIALLFAAGLGLVAYAWRKRR